MTDVRVLTPGSLTLFVTSTATSFLSEKRFPKDITLLDLKLKLELISGCNSSTMKLELYGQDDKYVTELSGNSMLLGSFNIDNGMRIHVSDPNLRKGEFDDISKVQKFELSETEYAQRKETMRAFKEKNKLGRFKEQTAEEIALEEEKNARLKAEEKERFDSFQLGDRCQVTIPNTTERLGCIKFLGETHFKEGLWVGVQYDEPVGKNDGSVDGIRYFECPPKYGGLVKPLFVITGDFPEEDLGLSDDEM